MAAELILDVRELEPPEPLQRVLAAVEKLQPGERIRMLHHREPCLLYPLLDQRGCNYRLAVGNEDYYEILIWRADDAASGAAA